MVLTAVGGIPLKSGWKVAIGLAVFLLGGVAA